jgi:hypothetical protein
MMGAVFRLVRGAVASLGVWILPIVVAGLTAAALSGSLRFHRGSGPSFSPDRDKAATDAAKPLAVIDLYYSGDYIKVVKKAHQERHDVLASVRTLESAWNAASPGTPLTIEMVSSVLPEPIAGKSPPPRLRASSVMDESTFQDLRPILEDLRNLILEGDGTGYGRLRCSGYQAQPTDAGKNLGARSGDTEAGFIKISPAKRVPVPAETL